MFPDCQDLPGVTVRARVTIDDDPDLRGLTEHEVFSPTDTLKTNGNGKRESIVFQYTASDPVITGVGTFPLNGTRLYYY